MAIIPCAHYVHPPFLCPWQVKALALDIARVAPKEWPGMKEVPSSASSLVNASASSSSFFCFCCLPHLHMFVFLSCLCFSVFFLLFAIPPFIPLFS